MLKSIEISMLAQVLPISLHPEGEMQ